MERVISGLKFRTTRRGLSTIVGAVFMVIVMIGALNVTLWTMQQQDSIADVVAEKSSASIDRLNERIDISDVKIEDDKFNLTVSNSGGRTTELGSMYLVNESATPKEQYRYDLSGLVVDSRQSASGIGTDGSVPFTVDTSAKYTAKVVTVSGNSAAMRIAPPGELDLKMSLYIIPPTITTGQDITVLFAVTNDSTDSLAYAVTPDIDIDLSCTPYPSVGCETAEIVTAESDVFIPKGSTYLFKQVYNVEGPEDTIITITATLENADPGSEVTETGRIVIVDTSLQSFYSEVIISSDLVQKPEIFVIMPSPFGESAQEGLWGITIVNPTSAPMEVSRIVANIFTTHIQTNGKPLPIWDEDCDMTEIYPASGWECIQANQLEWENTASPVTISALGAESFRVRVDPSNISEGDEPAFITSITVFTSMGQFAKTGYSGAVRDATAPMVNIYSTDTTTPATALQNSHMLGFIGDLAGSSPVTLNIALADLDILNTTYVKSGTQLVVNVPRGFINVDVASYAGFEEEPTVLEYTDGSTQVIATLAEHVGDTSAAEAKILSITATTPEVPDKRIFILHSLVDGQTNSNFSIGSFAQTALQVLP